MSSGTGVSPVGRRGVFAQRHNYILQDGGE